METSSSDLSSLSSSRRSGSSRLKFAPTTHRDSMDISTWTTPADKYSIGMPTAPPSSMSGDRSAQNTPPENHSHKGQDPTPSDRAELKRKREAPKEPPPDPMGEAMKPLTDEERRNWPGWVELESDPVSYRNSAPIGIALFNFILREYGVKDVKVQEVFTLEDEMLNLLPKPVYGLIFLFRYWDDEDKEVEELPKCPNHVWFANQILTITNACATIALLNIVMNVPKIDLGENLSAFKTETKRLKPAYRGQTLGDNEFIRNVHNSFARRMDMLNADLVLSNDFDKWKRAKNAKKKRGARKSQTKTKKKDEEEPGFHFIAYVPVSGVVWRLDGMQRQPVNLGEAGKDWMAVARENINLRIAQYDDGVQFNLLSLCRSPLRTIPEKLAGNLHSMIVVEKALAKSLPEWKQFIETDDSSLLLRNEPNQTFALTKHLIINSYVPESVQKKLKAYVEDSSSLMDLRRDLIKEQTELQTSYVAEAASIGEENEQAARRKIDYTPIIYNSIKELADQGVLKKIVRDLIDTGEMKQ